MLVNTGSLRVSDYKIHLAAALFMTAFIHHCKRTFFPLLSFFPPVFFSSNLFFLIPATTSSSLSLHHRLRRQLEWVKLSCLRVVSLLLVVLVQDDLTYLSSLRVLFLYSWLGVGESLVLLLSGMPFFFKFFFFYRAIFLKMGLMYRYQRPCQIQWPEIGYK